MNTWMERSKGVACDWDPCLDVVLEGEPVVATRLGTHPGFYHPECWVTMGVAMLEIVDSTKKPRGRIPLELSIKDKTARNKLLRNYSANKHRMGLYLSELQSGKDRRASLLTLVTRQPNILTSLTKIGGLPPNCNYDYLQEIITLVGESNEPGIPNTPNEGYTTSARLRGEAAVISGGSG